MKRVAPPFRADHVGSLLRPRELRQAFHDFSQGKLDQRAFGEMQDRCIRQVVALQESTGLDSITDGEFRRVSYWSHFVDAVEGLSVKESLFQFRDESGNTTGFTSPHADARLRRKHGISTDAFKFLKAATRRTPKVTMPSPSTMNFWRGPAGIDRSAYPDTALFYEDLARVFREELAELAALGATYIQIDEVPIAMLCDAAVRQAVVARGEDPDTLTALYVDAINAALHDKPAGLTVAVHLCRGNYKGKWVSEGGYDAVADQLFNRAAVDGFFLEYDSARAGGFAPLRFLPRGKIVVLGLVSTKTPVLERKEELRRRIDDAAKIVALEQLAISPQCGFASTVGGNPVTEDDEKRKLALVVETAAAVWG